MTIFVRVLADRAVIITPKIEGPMKTDAAYPLSPEGDTEFEGVKLSEFLRVGSGVYNLTKEGKIETLK